MSRPETRASQARQAEKVLLRLLRTPKTRSGLIAAVTSRMISRRFVFGWLSEKTRSGEVVELKSGSLKTYQIRVGAIVEAPAESPFPSWLDPRIVPSAGGRRVFIDGRVICDEQPAPALPTRRKKK